MIKRLFDITFSLLGLLFLMPLLLVLALLVALTSSGGAFYRQERIGKNGKRFLLYKFRTMVKDADKQGELTVGKRDARVTRLGYYLRKLKLDELPQLFNVLKGDMSFVGPRPEVPRYVALYNKEQRKVLSVKPGLTGYASLFFFDENEKLNKAADPEDFYIKDIMPAKLKLNMEYIDQQSFILDLKLIFLTLKKMLSTGIDK